MPKFEHRRKNYISNLFRLTWLILFTMWFEQKGFLIIFAEKLALIDQVHD